jgi:hypothetical protein
MSDDGAVDEWVRQLCLSEDEVAEFRLWWGTHHGQYRGMVARQDLVDFCQGMATKASAELDREQTLLATKKDMSDDQYETLMLSCSSLVGEITALRTVTEWAKKEVEKASGRFT